MLNHRASNDSHAAGLNVLHSAMSLSRLNAGISKIAIELGQAQQELGSGVQWACLEDEYLEADVAAVGTGTSGRVHALKASGILRSVWTCSLKKSVEPIVRDADILHVHGIWTEPNHTAAQLARGQNKPYLVAPHGMLEPWALRHHAWRKKVAAAIRERRLINDANCVHATANAELTAIRQFGYKGPIARVANGLNVEQYSVCREETVSQLRDPVKSRRMVLFLARLHPKKGLPLFLQSWAALKSFHKDWEFVIAGPDEDSHRRELELQIDRLRIRDSVRFVGEVYSTDKLALMRSADWFVLPSYSEGFSMAVLEAMACELPVLITLGCNFPEVASAGAGLVVETDVEDLARAASTLMNMTAEKRRSMGRSGRRLVEERHGWRKIAGKLEEVYRWILWGGTAPPCVDFY